MLLGCRGLPAYKLSIQSLKAVCTACMPGSTMEVLRLTAELELGEIHARWRLKGLPVHANAKCHPHALEVQTQVEHCSVILQPTNPPFSHLADKPFGSLYGKSYASLCPKSTYRSTAILTCKNHKVNL